MFVKSKFVCHIGASMFIITNQFVINDLHDWVWHDPSWPGHPIVSWACDTDGIDWLLLCPASQYSPVSRWQCVLTIVLTILSRQSCQIVKCSCYILLLDTLSNWSVGLLCWPAMLASLFVVLACSVGWSSVGVCFFACRQLSDLEVGLLSSTDLLISLGKVTLSLPSGFPGTSPLSVLIRQFVLRKLDGQTRPPSQQSRTIAC